MELKRFRAPVQLKDDAPGSLQAVFSTFNVVDSDGDIVLASAFTDGQPVPMTWSHDWSQPIGRGVIRVQGDRAIFDGNFFMDTIAGQEAYKTVKAMGDLQEYSWGFKIIDASWEQRDEEMVRIIKSTQVFEVSPVLVGAGEGTHTLGIKGLQLKGVSPKPSSTELAPEDTPWSKPALKDFTDKSWSDLSDDEKRQIAGHYAWAAQIPPDTFGDLKLPYCDPKSHKVVWKGVAAAGAALMGSQGGVDIPDADVPKVKARLAPFYKKFDKTPPWEDDGKGRSNDENKGLTLDDEIATVLAAVASVTARVQGVKELRLKEGRALSQARRDQMAQMRDQANEMAGHMDDHAKTARDLATSIDAMLDETAPKDPAKSADPANLARLRADFLRTTARINGVPILTH